MIQTQKTQKCEKKNYRITKIPETEVLSCIPVVILVMSPYDTGQSCHLQHEVVAHSCYELPSKPWLRLHCYAAHESQRPYNIHHDTKRKMHRVKIHKS